VPAWRRARSGTEPRKLIGQVDICGTAYFESKPLHHIYHLLHALQTVITWKRSSTSFHLSALWRGGYIGIGDNVAAVRVHVWSIGLVLRPHTGEKADCLAKGRLDE
jgi:hypothetical protein